MKFRNIIKIAAFSAITLPFVMGADDGGCNDKSSDQKQQEQQEILLDEGASQVGMPAITHFRERRLMKDILEMRDQENLLTYTYVYSEQIGKFTFLGESIGYGLPYATEFTNPQKIATSTSATGWHVIPQADPNGLFSPASADGTWILLRNPQTGKSVVTYIEPKIATFPFKLPANVVIGG